MIRIIIIAYKEPNTIAKAISSFKEQKLNKKYKIYVVCPDLETKNEFLRFKDVLHIQDESKGKPSALNLVFKKFTNKNDIMIFTDGDVFVGKDSLKELLSYFSNKEVGAVSGHPISLNPKDNILGYWSFVLTNMAHKLRLSGKNFVCTGYLMAIRNIVGSIPENSLSDDAIISNIILDKGYKIFYAPNALVYVKYPTTFKDWTNQKIRSAGGYYQIRSFTKSNIKMRRSFASESLGFLEVFIYAKKSKEFIYTILLLFARLYLWFMIFIKIKIRKQNFNKIWSRIESTK